MKKPFFVLLISGTELIKYPGISAAGASHEMLRYTAKLDAEFISVIASEASQSQKNPKLPVSPSGIVSPALIVKACLNLLNAKILIVDLGAHEKPDCDYISIRDKPSGDTTQENAFSLEEAQRLYLAGQDFASDLINSHGFDPNKHELVIAECLVGGTSTALGLLRGLGYDCDDLISSSIPEGNHKLKKDLVSRGLTRALNDNLDFLDQVKREPLLASATLGDALQPFITGLSNASIKNKIPITLAGGTQMLAIKALIDHKLNTPDINNFVSLATTPWVINDRSGNFNKLKRIVSNDTIIKVPDIERVSAHKTLDQEVQRISQKHLSRELSIQEIIENYNQGHVKEGVGLGGVLYLTLSEQEKIL